MKKILTFTFLIFTLQLSFAQISCVDLSAYTVPYLNDVSFDNTTYPVGTAFVTSGYIQYVKPSTGNYYQGIQGDSLFYVGDLDIDVSTAPCTDHTLTFSCAYLEGLAVDGDTIFSMLNPPSNYAGNGWTFQYVANGNYIISGDFDVASLYTQTNFLYDVCLECNTASSATCIDLSPYTVSYLNDVSFDNVTYPVGTAFVTTGYIQYVKPSTGNYYQGIQGDSLFYVGDLDIDVSTDPCTDHTLTFSCAYLEGLAVDGDTIFSLLNPPANYVGNGWTFEYVANGNYIISGDFDVASLYTQTNFLYDVCLECNTASTETCVDLSPYTVSYMNDVSFDNVTYPVGTAFVTTGYIQYVKPSINNSYGIQGDTLFHIGDVDIDVSTDPCTDHTLTFSCAYLEGLAVDGDTIFSMLNPPANYVGNGWTFEYIANGNYVISGDFDVASLYTQTNFLFDVCLICNNTIGIEEQADLSNSLSVYPNPSNGSVTISGTNESMISIYSTVGQLVFSESMQGGAIQVELKPGTYIVSSIDKNNIKSIERLIVQ